MLKKNNYKRKKTNRKNGSEFSFFKALIDIIINVIDKLGWPGAALVLIYAYVYNKGTPDLHQKIISKYILLEWSGNYWCIIIPVFVVSMIFAAHHFYYKNQLGLIQKELDRVVAERNKLQEEKTSKRLHHSSED